MAVDGSFGAYLRERRARLDPTALGYSGSRRRTPGLRREEVAQRAGISATWYSWLEQGRGGAPSARALDGVADALMLTEAEREHVFLLGLGRPPEVRYQPTNGMKPRLQRVLDTLDACPALIRTATWDVVAWNKAATAVLTDYGALPLAERNVLRLMFLNPQVRAANLDWESVASLIVGVFRADAARAGVGEMVQSLVDELCAKSSDFAAMWRNSAINGSCESLKRLHHPVLGEIEFEFSSFSVDGRPDLTMLVYTPISGDDATRVRALSGGM